MKKQMLLVFALLSIALSSNAIQNVTLMSAKPAPVIHCGAGEPYWVSAEVCCCLVSCSIDNAFYSNFLVCESIYGFAVNPPTTSTYYDVEIDISLNGSGPYSNDDITRYNNFKHNGGYTLSRDMTTTYSNGNTVTIKAGYYQITDGKIAVFAKSVTV